MRNIRTQHTAYVQIFAEHNIDVFHELVRIFVILFLRSPILSEDVANHVCYHCSNHTVVCLTIVTSEKQPTLS